MSDIALLMTGVLTTGQPSPPILPEQPLVQLDNGVEKSTRGQLSQLVLTAQITPPEFIHSNGTILATPSVHTTRETTGVQASLTDVGGNILQEFYYTKIVDKPQFTDEQGSDNKMVVTKSQQFTGSDMPTLYFGNSGISVRVLQRLLLSNGYTAVQVDGAFGALTEIAVKAFQDRRNLMVDGIVGQKTWYELTK